MFHDCHGHGRWSHLPKPVRIASHIVVGLVLASCVAVLFGYLTMVLWNAIMPAVFSLPVLGFWQAVGLLILARLLTGRFSHGHPHPGRFRRSRPGGSPESYAQWWDAEGQAAFNAYLRQKTAETGQDGSHER